MDIVCIGGGPAGLYFSILARSLDVAERVTVLERAPAGVTYGWGVVFWDSLLDLLHATDRVTAERVAAASRLWQGMEVRVGGVGTARLGGYGYAIGRQALLDLLARRAEERGVHLRYEHEVSDLSAAEDADLVVVADGAGSRVRERRSERFGTTCEVDGNAYLWLGTPKVFDAFTFAFERTEAGWVWFHAYPFDEATSTCIVECAPDTWRGLGLDRLGPAESAELLGGVFRAHLDGQPLVSRSPELGGSPWRSFRRVDNARWCDGNVALVGDAAHTTHFSIGSGTRLAIEDAVALARALRSRPHVRVALQAYEAERSRAIEQLRPEERNSARWFEEVDRHIGEDVMRFACAMAARREPTTTWWHALHQATRRVPLRRPRRHFGAASRWARAQRRQLAGARSPRLSP